MMADEEAKIFLSDERGLNQLDWFRSYNTFNFGNYFNEYKTAAGKLYVLNDDTLAGGKGFSMQVEEPTDILLIPVVGAINFKSANIAEPVFVEAGQSFLFIAETNDSFEVLNPYEDELVNFIQIWIKRKDDTQNTIHILSSFDLNGTKNSLTDLIAGSPFYKIGKYKGREEGICKRQNNENGFFVFIIEGAFEVKGRLLHARDGLAIWNTDEIDFEALSNNAIILILEI